MFLFECLSSLLQLRYTIMAVYFIDINYLLILVFEISVSSLESVWILVKWLKCEWLNVKVSGKINQPYIL